MRVLLESPSGGLPSPSAVPVSRQAASRHDKTPSLDRISSDVLCRPVPVKRDGSILSQSQKTLDSYNLPQLQQEQNHMVLVWGEHHFSTQQAQAIGHSS